jgi:hypothetical protein
VQAAAEQAEEQAAWARQGKMLAQRQMEASMSTKTAARCASLLLLGVLLTSCIGPGLEPPGGERGASNDRGPGAMRPTVDAGGPTDGFGNSGGAPVSPDPTQMPPGTDGPGPQPTMPPSEMDDEADADAGTDTGDESP